MAPRAASPARSENEFDIGHNLLGGDGSDESAGEDVKETQKQNRSSKQAPAEGLDMFGSESEGDDEAVIAQQLAAANRKTSLKGRKGGGFQAMGLGQPLLQAIARKGFTIPSPVQRKTIPLLMQGKDVVGMARTGSGKTLAFVVPMIEKLKTHSTQVGIRSLILAPARELAIQIQQVVNQLSKGTDLRSALLVGGESLESDFAAMSNNPDIVIATPGRFLHLSIEMRLDLSNVRYVAFDEADRLFELGFEAQLVEILHALPTTRQTSLFSATLPRSLVDFARAGLQDPVLVRLDADSKISPDLSSFFFTAKTSEKEGSLLHVLQNVIHVPTSSQLVSTNAAEAEVKTGKKRKRPDREDISSTSATIVFTCTKYHVQYLSHLLNLAGYAVSYVYGDLDQTARKMQVEAFRNGETNILVVTDVAARGVDVPQVKHVINYDFPLTPKIWLHRVGRTARAGQKGSSYDLVCDTDVPYLIDLVMFLGRKLTVGRPRNGDVSFTNEVVVGSLQRDIMQTSCEWVTTTLDTDADLAALRSVAVKGGKVYQRTRISAAAENVKRAKGITSSPGWTELHPLFNEEANDVEVEREKMLARVHNFRPPESIFEFRARTAGRKGNEKAIEAVQKIRSNLQAKQARSKVDARSTDEESDEEIVQPDDTAMEEASDSELEITFASNNKKKPTKGVESFRGDDFMSYTPSNHNFHEDRAYGVHSGTNANFAEAARTATMDLAGDEAGKHFGEARSVMRWDKRHKKYVNRANDEDGSKGKRLVRGESGAKIAASFRSGRYDAWKKANKIGRTPRVGETESNSQVGAPRPGGRFHHKSMKAPKPADKYRDDYDKKKKKFSEMKQKQREEGTNGRTELRSVDDIRKQRSLKEKRREKNARPSKKARR